MFGASNSGSTFGAPKPATTGFGAPSSGFSLGGSNNASTTQPTSGLFGAAKPSATGFGAPQQAQQSGGLFGGQNNNAGTAKPGLFGSNAASNTNTATPASGGLFGGNSQQTQSTGLFGSSAANAAPAATSGGLFGAKSSQPSTGGLFGSSTAQQPATGGLFGQQQQQQQPATGGLFGQQQQQQQQQSTLTSSQPSFAWSQQSTTQNQGQQQQQQPLSFLSSSNDKTVTNNNYAISMQEQLTKVKNSWDPTSQQTPLKTYFYNKVSENQSALYAKPLNEDDDWIKAYEKRPSSEYIPVRAVGFEDLQKRSQTQVNHVAQARVILQQISEKYKMLSDKHELDTASRIVASKARHTRISRRVLRLVSTLAVLKSKGYQLSPVEEKLIQNFQGLLDKSQDPSGLGKTNELWARLAILKEKAKGLSEQMDNSLGIKRAEPSEELDDGEKTQRQVLQIAMVLQQQQTGLNYLSEVIQQDKAVLDKLRK